MDRRRYLGSLVGAAGLLAGCAGSGGGATERPTGEVDVTFRTESDRSHDVAVELVDGDGHVVDTMASEFPPDQPGAPSFYAGGLSRGPYLLTVATNEDEVSVQWDVADCPRLELDVTVQPDASLRTERRCVEPAG